MSAAELLAAGLLAGIGEADPDLAVALDTPALVETCAQLAHLLWTPLMLERWGSHPRWAGARPDQVLAVLAGLGLPPEAPRSAVPARSDVCPEHPGALMRAGCCDWCLGARTDGPPPAWRDRGEARGIDLTVAEGARA